MWHSSFWAKMEIQRVGEQSRWAGRGKDIIIPTPPQKSKSDIFTFEFWVAEIRRLPSRQSSQIGFKTRKTEIITETKEL